MPTPLRLLPPLLVLAASLTHVAAAQDSRGGAWLAYAGNGHFSYPDPNARWRWWLDLHARFFEANGFEQSIVRPGVGYDVTKRSTVWLGYGWIANQATNGRRVDEHRVWQQYTYGRGFDAGNVFSRTRLEQRHFESTEDLGWRLRQFLRWTQPFSDGAPLGLRVWDEAFFDLNDTDFGQDTGFSQNRLFAGLGWTLPGRDDLTLEFGYLNQYIPRSGADDSVNHILAITLLMSR